MVDVATVLTVLVAAAASLFMAWTIGAGSSGSTPFAPAVGANAVSVMRAAFLVGLFGFAGAVLQGANISEAVGNELVRGVVLTPFSATTALLIAAVLVAIGVFAGYPIATAFTVTGAVVGAGLAVGGLPAWDKYAQIAALWVATPFLGGGAAYTTARLLEGDRVPVAALLAGLAGAVGLVVANIEFAVLGPPGESATIAGSVAMASPAHALWLHVAASLALALAVAATVGWLATIDVQVAQQRFLLILGALVAFSAGGSQVGLAVGPLLPMLDPFSVPLLAVLVGGGLGLLLGSWTGAPRMIKAIARDYSSLSPRRSIAALIPSFVIAQVAIAYGIPVSFNEIVVSAVVGSGYAGGGGVSRRKVVYTAGAWIGSLTLAGVAGYALVSVLAALLG